MAQRDEGPEGGTDEGGAKNLRQTLGEGAADGNGRWCPPPAPDGTQWQLEPRAPGCPSSPGPEGPRLARAAGAAPAEPGGLEAHLGPSDRPLRLTLEARNAARSRPPPQWPPAQGLLLHACACTHSMAIPGGVEDAAFIVLGFLLEGWWGRQWWQHNSPGTGHGHALRPPSRLAMRCTASRGRRPLSPPGPTAGRWGCPARAHCGSRPSPAGSGRRSAAPPPGAGGWGRLQKAAAGGTGQWPLRLGLTRSRDTACSARIRPLPAEPSQALTIRLPGPARRRIVRNQRLSDCQAPSAIIP